MSSAMAIIARHEKATPLTPAGQARVATSACIATSRTGKPCLRGTAADGVMYCASCMKSGDPSFRVASHPRAGKILVAARDLPKGYKVALWGQLKRSRDVKKENMEWAFIISKGQMIDPVSEKGSLVQYCPCAGPNEVAVVTPIAGHTYGGDKYASWVFKLNRRVPRNWQITMQYGDNSKGSDEFFAERGIRRCDVGTRAHPAFRRRAGGAPKAGGQKKAGAKVAEKRRPKVRKTLMKKSKH